MIQFELVFFFIIFDVTSSVADVAGTPQWRNLGLDTWIGGICPVR